MIAFASCFQVLSEINYSNIDWLQNMVLKLDFTGVTVTVLSQERCHDSFRQHSYPTTVGPKHTQTSMKYRSQLYFNFVSLLHGSEICRLLPPGEVWKMDDFPTSFILLSSLVQRKRRNGCFSHVFLLA